jgi:hypothetical protein
MQRMTSRARVDAASPSASAPVALRRRDTVPRR